MRGIVRAVARLFILVFIAVQTTADYIAMTIAARGNPTSKQRAQWLQRLSRMLLRRMRIAVEYRGEFPTDGLIVSNHMSYLDILLFSAVVPSSFVSRAEVRHWPGIGLAARLTGTVFVNREDLRATYQVNRNIEEVLSRGVPIIMFPEGKASGGASVLPFRSPLFECAIRTSATVTPAAISYTVKEGSVENDICYWGDMTFLPHVLKLLTRKGIHARVTFGTPITGYTDRKQAARLARDCVLRLRES